MTIDDVIPAAGKVLSNAAKYSSKVTKDRRDERMQITRGISQVMTDLQFNAVRYLDVLLTGNEDGLRKDLLRAYDNALRLRDEVKCFIPDYLRSTMGVYLDATCENMRYWQRRWGAKHSRLALSNDDIGRELPDVDQLRGKAGQAFDELQQKLKKYQQGPIRNVLSKLFDFLPSSFRN